MNERTTSALVMDQALSLLRRASPEQWVRGLLASLPLAAALLCLYALEHVLGVRPPLPLFGVLCALAYWARFRVLSGLAREFVAAIGEPDARSSGLALFKTAMVAGVGSWCWAVCLWAAEQRSFVFLLACLPLLSVRGALAPSLLARASCAPEAGWSALSRAAAETRGTRQLFAGVELLALLGMLTLFGNLYALAALVLLVSSSLLGLDVGFVTALIAPSNELVPLLLLGMAAVMLEPLRAAISALAFQHARERWHGADLAAAIERLSMQPSRRTGAQPSAARTGVLALMLLSGAALPARAEPPAPGRADDVASEHAQPAQAQPRAPRSAAEGANRSAEPAQAQLRAPRSAAEGASESAEPAQTQPRAPGRAGDVASESALPARAEAPAARAVDHAASDPVARQKARDILMRAEFQPSEADSRENTLGEWLERRLSARELSDRDAGAPPRFELSLPPLALTLLSLALMLAVTAWLARSLRSAKRRGAAAVSGSSPELTTAERVAEAARLAERAEYAASLRSLYIACLQALGRFDSTHTNGQLLQRLATSPVHAELERLTLGVERCSYGRQEATRADYEAARALADRILSTAQQQVQP